MTNKEWQEKWDKLYQETLDKFHDEKVEGIKIYPLKYMFTPLINYFEDEGEDKT